MEHRLICLYQRVGVLCIAENAFSRCRAVGFTVMELLSAHEAHVSGYVISEALLLGQSAGDAGLSEAHGALLSLVGHSGFAGLRGRGPSAVVNITQSTQGIGCAVIGRVGSRSSSLELVNQRVTSESGQTRDGATC